MVNSAVGDGVAAVVTGHTRGLGEGVAKHLLANQVRVLAIARGRSEQLARIHGDALTQVQLDLADAAALGAWLKSDALGAFLGGSRTALLVNNAGVLQPIGPLQAQDSTVVSRAVAVNVAAALMLSAEFSVATTEVRDRRILHVSSGAARHPYAGWSVYCATKAALDHHARAVALDRTPGLRISSVAPGVIDTEMQAEIRAAPDENFPDRPRFIAMKREGRLRSADEAGRDLVAFLLSGAFGSEPVTDLRELAP